LYLFNLTLALSKLFEPAFFIRGQWHNGRRRRSPATANKNSGDSTSTVRLEAKYRRVSQNAASS
jgi:hypothetical protein